MTSSRTQMIANSKDGLVASIYFMKRGKGVTDYKQSPPNFSINKNDCYPGAFFFRVFSCGCSLKYETEYDIPESSVKCKHGIKLIEYLDV